MHNYAGTKLNVTKIVDVVFDGVKKFWPRRKYRVITGILSFPLKGGPLDVGTKIFKKNHSYAPKAF